MAESRDATELHWFDPPRRGIFPLDSFHISRSLARRIRRGDYKATTNADFEAVMRACAAREETWINEDIIALYTALHRAGFAHSQEIWQQGQMVGGVYGIALGSAFFGESMFSTATDASKLALAHLIARLKASGYTLFDTQYLTPHLASLGAIEISRKDYRARLERALALKADFHENQGTVLPQ